MQPEQPTQSTQPAQQVATPPEAPVQQQPVANKEPAFYRKYWPFGLIFVFAPLGIIFGIYVLLTGDVFKNDKTNGAYTPISKREKTTLIIIGLALQLFAIVNAVS